MAVVGCGLSGVGLIVRCNHWLNMELDLQSCFGLLCTVVLIGCERYRILGSYTRALLISQDRRHLFVTPALGVAVGGSWLLLI
jgi:hypothetical protein